MRRLLEQVRSVSVLDGGDDGVNSRSDCRGEDIFRRATFAWALAAKRMVESSAALGPGTKVPATALADIEYVRDALTNMRMPPIKTVTTGDDRPPVTVVELKESVSDLIARAEAEPELEPEPVPEGDREESPTPATVDPPVVVKKPRKTKKGPHQSLDLSAPVTSKNGRMEWAMVDCPVCSSVAGRRCLKADGSFMEKPHKARIDILVL